MVYHGSNFFLFISIHTGISLDQINFAITELVALISGIILRAFIQPCEKNSQKRHIYVFLVGVVLAYFCFGLQIWHLFFQAIISYILLLFVPRSYVSLAIFAFTMSYLSYLHIYRLLYDYGNFSLEITSPFMINTQKLTALAFAYSDGRNNETNLTKDQKEQAIKKCPNLIEFFSYLFNFQTIIVGPLCFYQDYIEFITGKNISKHQIVVLKKLLILFVLIIAFFKSTVIYQMKSNLDPQILSKPIYYRFLHLWVCGFSARVRYYIAWTMADIVANASGFGFRIDNNNNVKWDLLTNVNILNFEFATSFKMIIDGWNITTQIWLRRICFDRLPTLKTIGVFVLSAVWHGFYPGYYFTFVVGAFSVYAGRGIRRKIRPIFQVNTVTKAVYDALTWFCTTLMINYTAASFDLVEFWICIEFYNSFYWSLTILVILTTFALPGGSTKKHYLNTKSHTDGDFKETETQQYNLYANKLNSDEKNK